MKVVLGIGCDRDISQHTLETAVDQALALINQPRTAIMALATIDRKCDEVALLALAAEHGWSLHLYSAKQLSEVPVPNPSAVVEKYMGTPAVAEAAALLAAQTDCQDLLLEKHKYRGSDNKNATVSIVRLRHA